METQALPANNSMALAGLGALREKDLKRIEFPSEFILRGSTGQVPGVEPVRRRARKHA